MGINVLPPDINESQRDFSVSGDAVRFGLAAVKNVGVGAIDSIIAARDEGEKFTCFSDFCNRVDQKKVNKRVIESLIKCGAFDSTGHHRRQLFSCYENVMEVAQHRLRERSSVQVNFLEQFEQSWNDSTQDSHGNNSIPNLPEWDHKELLTYEKDTIGFYITGHPLSNFSDRLGLMVSADSSNLASKSDRETVSIAGIVSNIRDVSTKRKETMAYITLEDLKGTITVIFFPEIYRNYYDLLHDDEPLLIRGSLDVGEETAKVIATEALPLSVAAEKSYHSAYFTIDLRKSSTEDLGALRNILKKYQGKNEVFFRLLEDQSETLIYLGEEMKVDLSLQLKLETDQVLGNGATVFL